MKRLLLFILTLCTTSTLFAQTFTDNGINYNVTSDTTVEVGFNPDFTGAAVILSSVNYKGVNYEVNNIGNQAFTNCTKLTSVNLPLSVTNIGSGSFSGCTGLTSINLPISVVRIGHYAFLNCIGLLSITIPESVINIESEAFAGCSSLKYVSIPTSVTNIAHSVFRDCTRLSSIYIPNSVSSIGVEAFSYCSSLTAVDIPNSVTNIGANAFSQCTNLTINIPNSVTSIGLGAFSNSGLTTIDIPNSVTIIEASTFTGCGRLTSVIIPNSITSIGEDSFGTCTGLLSITIPNSVTSIGKMAFNFCGRLTELNLSNFLKTIGVSAFGYCDRLTSVIIPNSVTSIDDFAFEGCTALKSVTVNWATPLNIDASVFDGVPLASATLYVPAGTKAAYKASPVWKNFRLIIEMQPITFTVSDVKFTVTGPTTIEVSLTPNFTGALTIPSSVTYDGKTYDVTSIANNAFAVSAGLTSINIPNTVINIGDYAFANLTGLTSVTVNWTTPLIINETVFGNMPAPTPSILSTNNRLRVLANTNISSVALHVPAGTLDAYKATAVWKDFGTITESSLPLTLTSFTAKTITTGNQINWTTADAVNVKNIVLERSGSDNTFSHLATLPVTANQYIDINPLAGDNYYRLSTIDNDGDIKTYPQIALVKGFGNEMSFYPNPITNGVLNIVSGGNKLQSVALFDLNGKKVVFVNNLNSTKKVLVNTQGLVKGVYLLEINSEKTKVVKKVVVN